MSTNTYTDPLVVPFGALVAGIVIEIHRQIIKEVVRRRTTLVPVYFARHAVL